MHVVPTPWRHLISLCRENITCVQPFISSPRRIRTTLPIESLEFAYIGPSVRDLLRMSLGLFFTNNLKNTCTEFQRVRWRCAVVTHRTGVHIVNIIFVVIAVNKDGTCERTLFNTYVMRCAAKFCERFREKSFNVSESRKTRETETYMLTNEITIVFLFLRNQL